VQLSLIRQVGRPRFFTATPPQTFDRFGEIDSTEDG
jgi:hypothetical protein